MVDLTSTIAGFDAGTLYEKHEYSDLKAGIIGKFVPVDKHGVRDVSRPVMFTSDITLNYGGRPMQVGFIIEGAVDLAAAIEMFPAAAAKAGNDQLEALEKARLQHDLQKGLHAPAIMLNGRQKQSH